MLAVDTALAQLITAISAKTTISCLMTRLNVTTLLKGQHTPTAFLLLLVAFNAGPLLMAALSTMDVTPRINIAGPALVLSTKLPFSAIFI